MHLRVGKKLCLSLQPFHPEKSRSNPLSAETVTGGKLNARNHDGDTPAGDFSSPGVNAGVRRQLPGLCRPPIQRPPGTSDDMGFLPRAHGWRSSNGGETATTVPPARGKCKHQKHAPEAKGNRKVLSSAGSALQLAGQAHSSPGGTCARGAGANSASTAPGSSCQ